MRSAVLLSCLFAASLAAQTRETIDVRVLELEVSVLDRQGRAVDGLTAADFAVRIGGRAVPITNFYATRAGKPVDESRDQRAPEVGAAQTAIPTSLVIFIDETHLHQGSRKRALEALQRYIRANVGPLTSASVMRFNKQLDLRVRPTDRPGYILGELERLSREPSIGGENNRERETMIEEIDDVLFKSGMGGGNMQGESPDTIFYRVMKYAERRAAEVDHTLKALEEAVDLASGFEGRKVLLYVSEGLPQQPGSDLVEYWDAAYRRSAFQLWRGEAYHLDASQIMRLDRTAHFDRVARRAQRGRVAIYALDVGGVRGYEGRTVEFATRAGTVNTTLMNAALRGGLQYVADETGGRYIGNENDFDRALLTMSEQFSTYYSLGVQPRRGEIEVTVKNRPELRVMASRRRPPRTREEELDQSVRARLYTRVTENPLDARLDVGPAMRVDGQCVVLVRVAVAQQPLQTPTSIETLFVMVNERNDESDVRTVIVPFSNGRAEHALTLRIQPQRHVLSMAFANPDSGETSYLQRDIDGTPCR